jgi:hypothetical protein
MALMEVFHRGSRTRKASSKTSGSSSAKPSAGIKKALATHCA